MVGRGAGSTERRAGDPSLAASLAIAPRGEHDAARTWTGSSDARDAVFGTCSPIHPPPSNAEIGAVPISIFLRSAGWPRRRQPAAVSGAGAAAASALASASICSESA